MRNLFVAGSALLFCSLPLLGQLPPLPPGPVPAKVSYAKWQVKDSTGARPVTTASGTPPEGAAALPAPAAVTVTIVTKTEDVYFEQVTDANGKNAVIWKARGVAAYKGDDDSSYKLFAVGDTEDFPECSWIGPGNYIGIKSKNGHSCFVFKDRTNAFSKAEINDARARDGANFNPESYKQDSEAYLDVQSLLPIFVQNGGETFEYTYETPPSQKQQLPPDVLKAMAAEQQRAKDLNRRPARS